MKSFLFGLGIGIGLGVLFAPMSGEETRNRLSESASDLASSARESIEQGKDRVRTSVNSGVSAIRDVATNVSGQVQRATGTESSTGTQSR